jgi:hypothetical protein
MPRRRLLLCASLVVLALVLAATAALALIGAAAEVRPGPGQGVIDGRLRAHPAACRDGAPGSGDCVPDALAGLRVDVLHVDGTPAATARSDGDGRFRVALDPGVYRVVARPVDGQAHLVPTVAEVRVVEGGTATADVVYDLGPVPAGE